MQHNPFWEVYRFSVSHKIPLFLWNPKVHYRIYKCPPHILILSLLDKFITSHHTSWRSVLIWSFHRSQIPKSSIFPSGFPENKLQKLLLSLLSPKNSYFSILSSRLSEGILELQDSQNWNVKMKTFTEFLNPITDLITKWNVWRLCLCVWTVNMQ